MLFIITDTKDDGSIVQRQSIFAQSADEARRIAGKMPTNTRTTTCADSIIEATLKLLNGYLAEFPEHDQGDFRVWEAAELLQRLQAK